MKPDFDRAEFLARKLRLSQENNCLSLDVTKMTFDLPIIIDTFENYSLITKIPINELTINGTLKDGYTVCYSDVYIVLYHDNTVYDERLNWTLAHEVGHIYLNHTKDENNEEVETHWFAAELLAPEIIIREIARQRNKIGKSLDAFDIQELFHISYEASMKRVSSINRKCVFNTYLKKETIMKYQEHILRHGFVCNITSNTFSESRSTI